MGKKIHLQNHREEFTPDYYDRITHCEKNVRIRSYSGLHFSRIRTEYREIFFQSV